MSGSTGISRLEMPFLFCGRIRENLAVIADGSSVVSFDPLTGRRKWSTGLADFPIQRPDLQVTGSQTALYAASQGTLRGISLADGHIRFESYLGDIAPQWRSTLIWPDRSTLSGVEPTADTDDGLTNQDIIATWPISQKPDQSRRVMICGGITGEIVQSPVRGCRAKRNRFLARRSRNCVDREKA